MVFPLRARWSRAWLDAGRCAHLSNPYHSLHSCCSIGIDDVSFARALVTSVAGLMPIRADAVFSMGFSNGAFMTERLACEVWTLLSLMST